MSEDVSATVSARDLVSSIVALRGPLDDGPALVIAPSAFGVTDDLRAQMAELAPHAALVASYDPFWRGDGGPLPYSDFAGVMRRLRALDPELAARDYREVVAWTRRQSGVNDKIVGLGICFGGPFAFLAAAEGVIEALATWHGTRLEALVDRARDVRCPAALHFGEKDRVVPPEAVQRVREAFVGRDDVRVVVHAGADHGFTHASGPTWVEAATTEAKANVVRLLAG